MARIGRPPNKSGEKARFVSLALPLAARTELEQLAAAYQRRLGVPVALNRAAAMAISAALARVLREPVPQSNRDQEMMEEVA